MMSQELKARLAENKKRRRKETVLLRDVEPMSLVIHALDHFDEHATTQQRLDDREGYLSYSSKDQIAALASYIASSVRTVRFRFGSRLVTVFSFARLEHSLKGCGVSSPSKYLREIRKPKKKRPST